MFVTADKIDNPIQQSFVSDWIDKRTLQNHLICYYLCLIALVLRFKNTF